MISLGDLLVFLAAAGITLAYVFVVYRFISRSEKSNSPNELTKPAEKNPPTREGGVPPPP